MTDLVSELSDCDGIEAAKKQALRILLERAQEYESKFTFKHNGHTMVVWNVEANEIPGNWRALVQTGSYMGGVEATEVIEDDLIDLAENLFAKLNTGNLCRFCGQPMVAMMGDICLLCAKDEMKTPCITCGKVIGRSTDPMNEDDCEHPACKKRRLA